MGRMTSEVHTLLTERNKHEVLEYWFSYTETRSVIARSVSPASGGMAIPRVYEIASLRSQ